MSPKPKILIHLHVYYHEQLAVFLKKIHNIKEYADYKLIITVCETDSFSSQLNGVLKDENVEIIKVSNKGFDVGPFVEVLHSVDLDEYDYVLKLHTKSRGNEGKTLLNGVLISNSVWEDIMIDSLIGSKERINQAIECFNDDTVGMAVASLCLIKDDKKRLNYYFYRVNDELKKIGMNELKDKDSFRFAAGTMFIIRTSLLKPLLKYSIDDFGINYPNIHDYTLAHVFERLFTGLVYSSGYRVAELKAKDYGIKLKEVEIRHKRVQKKEIGESPLANFSLFIRRIKSKVEFKFRKEYVIANSKYFDRDWYASKYPEVADSGLSPEEHYLLHGNEYGYNPSPSFNGYEYIYRYPDLIRKKINPLLHYECYGKYEHRLFYDNPSKLDSCIDTINKSEYFDEQWYLDNNKDVKESGINPAMHYFLYGGFEGRDPSPLFCNAEYLSIHKDVKKARINPLYHFEYDGYIQGREISSLEFKEPVFEPKAVNCHRSFNRSEIKNRRTAILASYTTDGKINDSLIYLIKGLKEVTDNIVVFGDCPIIESELSKLAGLVTYAEFDRHGQYDFGSYSRGLKYLRENGLLNEEDVDELILINDSCYGPVFPFKESFDRMKNEIWDFWGYVGNRSVNYHICSFFYIFNRKVINSRLLDEFMERVKGQVDRSTAISEFEIELSYVLTSQGLLAKTYVPSDGNTSINHRNILTLLRDYKVPLIKKKSINGDAKENITATLKLIEKYNPELYSMIKITPINTDHHVPDLSEYRESLKDTVIRIRNKIKEGKKVKVLFFVSDFSMFPARPIFENMLEDELFDSFLAVIPDSRISNSYKKMEKCFEELKTYYNEERLLKAEKDRFGRWIDLVNDADMVFYPLPYNISDYRYNIRYALGRHFLPVIVNYGFYRSIYDRDIMSSYNYAYYWKVFMECEETMDEYKKYSVLKGGNATISGYAKMDLLNSYSKKESDRKKILVALHHSIDEGFNDALALANFVRYYDYFLNLPDKYPDIDFIYRPHPFLFEALRKAQNWNEKQIEDYKECMKNKKNVIWSDGGNYFEEFADSDACIQDCGSFLVEYLYTGNPCCYMLKTLEDIDKKFAPLGKDCLDQCYISYSTEDIDDFINEVVIKGNDDKKEKRQELAKRVMVNYPFASKKAIEIIKEELLQK